MYILILYIIGQGSAVTVVPDKYPNLIQCEEAIKDWDSWGLGMKHKCILAPTLPKSDRCTVVPNSSLMICN